MSDSWNTTQSRLRKWQKEPASAWELRRILGESDYFKVIAGSAYRRQPAPQLRVGWQDWWAFHLERMPEKAAIGLLLDVWNKDVWAHMSRMAANAAHEALAQIVEHNRLAHEFSAAFELIISNATQDTALDGDAQSSNSKDPD